MNISKQANVSTSGTPDAKQLEKINRQAKSPLSPEEVYVFSVRLCDDRIDRDFERFSAEALPKLAELFLGRTGILDHEWSAENQLARIFDTCVEQEDGAAYLKAWAYILRGEKNADAIREIEAGIRREVSIGCAMAKSVCSICGEPYGTCEHQKGAEYGGQICCAILSEPTDAYEFSFVAVPAQPKAGVMKKSFADEAELLQLRKEAALGREYRKQLRQNFVRLALTLDLGLSEALLQRMAEGLDAEQLLEAETVLRKKAAVLYPAGSQLSAKREVRREDDGAFLV